MDVQFHRVEKFFAGEIQDRKITESGQTYYVRHLAIFTYDGDHLELTLFSDDPGKLLMHLEDV